MSDYGFVHEERVYTPDQSPVTVAENQDRNHAIERAELAHWAGRPDASPIVYYKFPADIPHSFKPLAGFPYDCEICRQHRGLSPELCERSRTYRAEFRPAIAGAVITTWLGTTIGEITSARVYQHNFGSRMVAITVKGTNGRTYYGRASWDHDCVRLRARKGAK